MAGQQDCARIADKDQYAKAFQQFSPFALCIEHLEQKGGMLARHASGTMK
jgi:hypothetical protein